METSAVACGRVKEEGNRWRRRAGASSGREAMLPVSPSSEEVVMVTRGVRRRFRSPPCREQGSETVAGPREGRGGEGVRRSEERKRQRDGEAVEKGCVQLGAVLLIPFPLCLDAMGRAAAVALRGCAPQCPSPWPRAHCCSPLARPSMKRGCWLPPKVLQLSAAPLASRSL